MEAKITQKNSVALASPSTRRRARLRKCTTARRDRPGSEQRNQKESSGDCPSHTDVSNHLLVFPALGEIDVPEDQRLPEVTGTQGEP